jgi:hypothetical protein
MATGGSLDSQGYKNNTTRSFKNLSSSIQAGGGTLPPLKTLALESEPPLPLPGVHSHRKTVLPIHLLFYLLSSNPAKRDLPILPGNSTRQFYPGEPLDQQSTSVHQIIRYTLFGLPCAQLRTYLRRNQPQVPLCTISSCRPVDEQARPRIYLRIFNLPIKSMYLFGSFFRT